MKHAAIIALLAIGACLSCGCGGPQRRSTGYLEIHAATDEKTPGFLAVRIPNMDEPIYVNPEIALTDENVAKAIVMRVRTPQMGHTIILTPDVKSLHGKILIPDPSQMDEATADISTSSQQLGYGVIIEWTRAGRRKMKTLTSRNKGERLAVVLGGRVIAAPRIGGQIKNMLLYGSFTQAEAEALADTINHGPAPLK